MNHPGLKVRQDFLARVNPKEEREQRSLVRRLFGFFVCVFLCAGPRSYEFHTHAHSDLRDKTCRLDRAVSRTRACSLSLSLWTSPYLQPHPLVKMSCLHINLMRECMKGECEWARSARVCAATEYVQDVQKEHCDASSAQRLRAWHARIFV